MLNVNQKQEEYKEIELKLEITQDIYSQILSQFPAINQVLQENLFFDSKELTLHKNLWALRLRFEEGKAFLTAKGPKIQENNVHIRPEYEVEINIIEANRLQSGINPATDHFLPLTIISEKFGNVQLVPLFQFTNLRTYIPWKEWVWELDKTTIKNTIIYELEIETSLDWIDKLKSQIEKFFIENSWEIVYSQTNKFYRALQITNEK